MSIAGAVEARSVDVGLEESRLVLGEHVVLVERRAGGGVLKVVSAEGELPLEISLTKEGAVLRLGRGLIVSVNGALAFDVGALSIHARERIDLTSDGAVALRAGGDLLTDADAQTIVARRGDVDVRANDDVRLTGERIRLNG